MKSRRKLLLTVAVVVFFAIVAFAAFLLLGGLIRLGQSEKKLNRALSSYEQMFERDPFPSEENVAVEKQNLAVMDDWFTRLMRRLRQGQIGASERSPSKFKRLLENSQSKMANHAEQKGTELPEGFKFGFDRYFGSAALPSLEVVPDLSIQLAMIEGVCAVLFDAEADGLLSVAREDIEDTRGARTRDTRSRSRSTRSRTSRRRRPGVPAPEETAEPAAAEDGGDEALYRKFHFVMEFRAEEETALDVIDRLARHEMFVVVTSLEFTKAGTDVLSAPADAPDGETLAADAREGKEPQFPPLSERIISGPKKEPPMKIRMEFDVYLFKEV
jgi:hypothetical protein